MNSPLHEKEEEKEDAHPKTRLQIMQEEDMDRLLQKRMLSEFKNLIESHGQRSIVTSQDGEQSMHQAFLKSQSTLSGLNFKDTLSKDLTGSGRKEGSTASGVANTSQPHLVS